MKFLYFNNLSSGSLMLWWQHLLGLTLALFPPPPSQESDLGKRGLSSHISFQPGMKPGSQGVNIEDIEGTAIEINHDKSKYRSLGIYLLNIDGCTGRSFSATGCWLAADLCAATSAWRNPIGAVR